MYQKTAFSAVALLGAAFLSVWMFGPGSLGILLAAAVIAALLTLPLTWKLIMSVIQVTGMAISLAGHGSGRVGDAVRDYARRTRVRLSESKDRTARVPSWENGSLVRMDLVSEVDAPYSDPSFLEGVMERQNA